MAFFKYVQIKNLQNLHFCDFLIILCFKLPIYLILALNYLHLTNISQIKKNTFFFSNSKKKKFWLAIVTKNVSILINV